MENTLNLENALYNFTINSKNENDLFPTNGRLYVEGKKYFIDTEVIDQIYDGSILYTIIHENKEIIVTSESNTFFNFSPVQLFNFFKDDFDIDIDNGDNKSIIVPITIQLPKNTPIGPIKLCPVWIDQINPDKHTQSTNTAKNFLSVFGILALFQDKFDPKGNIKPNKIIKGVKAALKNGGPTESFLSKNNSATNGQIVPKKITKADTASNTLFEISAVSLLASEKTL